MLEDAAGIRRIVLACGTVDLRKGIDGLATIVGDKYGQNLLKREPFSCSVESGLTDAKGFCGWARVFCFYIKDSKLEDCHGQEIHRRLQTLRKTSFII